MSSLTVPVRATAGTGETSGRTALFLESANQQNLIKVFQTHLVKGANAESLVEALHQPLQLTMLLLSTDIHTNLLFSIS